MKRAQIATSSSIDNVDAVNAIRRKLRDAKVKVASIIHRCEQKDRNSDGLIHIDDLEDIFNEVVDSEYRITRRELMKFVTSIVSENKNDGSIMYEKIADILEPAKKRAVSIEEHWQDDGIDEGDTAWATQPGSVGEWLKRSACPAEIRNFKNFVSCLERFERDSGMKISLKEDGGFTVPLGPDLRASISFFMP